MKKFLSVVLFCTLCVTVVAQIPTITPTAQKIQFVSIDGGTGLSVDHETNTFCMIVGSDNQFEQKFAQITLGKTAYEAMTSLVNLRNVITQENTEFQLEGYSFFVTKGKIYILNHGKLDYTAGEYFIKDTHLLGMMKYFLTYQGASFGDDFVVTANFFGKFSGMVDLRLPKYNVDRIVLVMSTDGFNCKFTSIFKAKEGYVLTKQDIQKIARGIENGQIKNDADALLFLNIAEAVR